MKRKTTFLAILLAATFLLLAGAGCDDPVDPRDHATAGRLRGRVVTGADPRVATILATRVNDPASGSNDFLAHPNDEGRFSLDLPPGDYVVRLRPTEDSYDTYDYSHRGLGYGQFEPDTLTIRAGESPPDIDFELGSITVHLDLPRSPANRKGGVYLFLRDEPETEYGLHYLNFIDQPLVEGRASILLPGVAPGDYRIMIATGEYVYGCREECLAETFWMPLVADSAGAPWYEVQTGAMLDLTCTVPTESARIEGKVTGAWLDFGMSTPPEVSVVSPDSVVLIDGRPTGSGGDFSFDFNLPRPVKLLVSHEGVDQYVGGPAFGDATVFDLVAGETIAGVELVQSGLRLDARDKDIFIYGPTVTIHDPDDLRVLAVADWRNGPGELAGITNLWPGEFLLHLGPGPFHFGRLDWRPQWFDRADDPGNAVPVVIDHAGQVVRLDVTLEKGGVMSGRLDPLPEDFLYRDVVLVNANDDIVVSEAFVYMSNTFRFRGLPDGTYKVGATPEDSRSDLRVPAPEGTVWYPGTTDWSQAQVIGIVDASEVTDLVIPLD